MPQWKKPQNKVNDREALGDDLRFKLGVNYSPICNLLLPKHTFNSVILAAHSSSWSN